MIEPLLQQRTRSQAKRSLRLHTSRGSRKGRMPQQRRCRIYSARLNRLNQEVSHPHSSNQMHRKDPINTDRGQIPRSHSSKHQHSRIRIHSNSIITISRTRICSRQLYSNSQYMFSSLLW